MTLNYYLRIVVSVASVYSYCFLVIFKVWEFTRNANSQAPPPSTESETGGRDHQSVL